MMSGIWVPPASLLSPNTRPWLMYSLPSMSPLLRESFLSECAPPAKELRISFQGLRQPICLVADRMARFDDKFDLLFQRENFPTPRIVRSWLYWLNSAGNPTLLGTMILS